MADLAALDAHIARLRQLEQLGRDAGPAVAAGVQRALEQQLSQGLGPDGKPWTPTRDGQRPLAGAASAVQVRAVDDVVVCRIEGVHARHDQGWVRGRRRRQMLPDEGTMPPHVELAVSAAVAETFRRTMGEASDG